MNLLNRNVPVQVNPSIEEPTSSWAGWRTLVTPWMQTHGLRPSARGLVNEGEIDEMDGWRDDCSAPRA